MADTREDLEKAIAESRRREEELAEKILQRAIELSFRDAQFGAPSNEDEELSAAIRSSLADLDDTSYGGFADEIERGFDFLSPKEIRQQQELLRQFASHNVRKPEVVVAPEVVVEAKPANIFLETLAKINPIISSAAITEAGIDAHTYTTTIIRPHYQELKAIDDSLKITMPEGKSEINFPQIEQLVKTIIENKQCPERVNFRNAKIALNSIRGEGRRIDGETGINPLEILQRTWNLCERINESQPELSQEAYYCIATCLSDNQTDSGGCIPGIIARLYPIYVQMLKIRLEQLAHEFDASEPEPRHKIRVS